jgi:hypothetical protein
MSESNTKQFPRSKPAKIAESGPDERIKARFKKFDVEYIRYFLGGPSGEVPTEIIFHRPIGITDLDGDDWIRSSPEEVAVLHARIASPKAKHYVTLQDNARRDAAIKAKLVKLDTDGQTLLYPSGKNRAEFLKPLRKSAEETSKKAKAAFEEWKKMDKKLRPSSPPAKPTPSECLKQALEASSEEDAKAELAYTKYILDKKLIDKAREDFADPYRTCKGTSNDTPQVPIAWAKGLSCDELQQILSKVVEDLVDLNKPLKEKLIQELSAATKPTPPEST